MSFLEDCVNSTLRHLHLAKERLERLDLSNGPEAAQDSHETIMADILFLETSLTNSATYLSQSREKIKTLADLKQSETSGIVSLIFAAFVPLAGVASYLGMNTIGVAQGNIPTSTFWEAAIPLTGAVYVILWSTQTIVEITTVFTFLGSVFAVRKWPLLIDIGVIIICAAVPIIHIGHWRLSTDGYFVHYFNPISPQEPIIVNSLLAVLEFLKCAEHIIQRNKRAKKWFGLFLSIFLVDVLCAGLSTIDSTPATLVTPICYTIAVSSIIRPLLF